MKTPLPIVAQTDVIPFAGDAAIGSGSASAAMLRNTDDHGMLIDQIGITGFPVAGGFGALNVFMMGVSVRLRWRNEPLTNGYLPVTSITYPRNRRQEYSPNPGAMILHLARPMYLPANDFIAVDFQWALMAPGTVGVFAAGPRLQAYAIGRQALPPARGQRWLPYFTSFVTPAVNGELAQSYEFVSDPPDLGNPFDSALHVERMIGRVLSCGDTGVEEASDTGPSPVWSIFKAKITDDRDNVWAPQAGMPSVFNVLDRSWIVNTQLRPKAFLTATVSKDNTTWSPATYARFQRAVIGLVGYRQIEEG